MHSMKLIDYENFQHWLKSYRVSNENNFSNKIRARQFDVFSFKITFTIK